MSNFQKKADRHKKWRKDNPEAWKRAKKKAALKAAYGITLDQYEHKFKEQNGVCDICKKTPEERSSRSRGLSVDHNHATGKIRGLLCHVCNTFLSVYEAHGDNVRAYMEKHSG